MSGDYSRVSFDPSMDIAGVLMQQGRVQIDSDWNTWVAALDRRMRAESVDTFGVHPSPDKSGVAVVSAHTPDAFKIGIAVGAGLYGEYFDDINLSNCKLTRTDATINFDWGSGSPDAQIGADTFSVRWSGSVLATVTGNYIFHTVSDDGVRLWVNNQLLIDNWTDHGATENNSNSIALTAGQKYDIKLEYYENGGAASIKLLWTPPGQAKQIIPQAQLFSPNINIVRGRMYVDGLLAENHGGGATEFDSVLAELRGKDPLFYNNQPYLPNPPAMPGSGTHPAYLEVWQREATHHQLPDIVEKAVGVETTTRLQTVWQVRFLGNDATGKDCSTPDGSMPGWADLIRPSGGRMSIQTGAVNTNTDPCELPVGGGYRGLENQLYRIEIHDGGGLGAATFKWSRENASVESNVMEIITNTKNKLKLASLGRDEVLRFSKDDWVEILDDVRELGGEGGDSTKRRGVMRKITDIDEVNLTITLSSDLPGDLIADKATLALRNTRVRRWDQKGEVRYADNTVCVANLDTTGGLIPVPNNGKWVVLEKNIQVQFSLDPAGGDFHSNDYWLSAARTADASMETFTQAPPRGIHRHYARLAMVSFPLQGGVDIPDCRIHWPPECGSGGCCTVTVAPGESIQKAIDSLPKEGGCVCLKTGEHKIDKTLTIESPNIALRGEGPGAIVRSSVLPALIIGSGDAERKGNATGIVVEGILFEAVIDRAVYDKMAKATAAAMQDSAMLFLGNCSRVRVERCVLAVAGKMKEVSLPVIGILLENTMEIGLTDNIMGNLYAGIISSGKQGHLHIADNAISSAIGLTGKSEAPFDNCGILLSPQRAQTCLVENNRIEKFQFGIHVLPPASGAVIAGNLVIVSNTQQPPVITGTKLSIQLCAIYVEAEYCEVRDNQIEFSRADIGKEVKSLPSTDKIIASVSAGKRIMAADGFDIQCAICCLANDGVGANYVEVRDNQLIGFGNVGILLSGITSPTVIGNHIEGSTTLFGMLAGDCTDACIENNYIRASKLLAINCYSSKRSRISKNRIEQALIGIFAQGGDLEISGNTLQSCQLTGISLDVSGATAVLHNRLFNCGYFQSDPAHIIPTMSMDISEEYASLHEAVDTGSNLRIEGCEIIDTGISTGGTVATGSAIGINVNVRTCQITGNRVGYTQFDKLDAKLEHRALKLMGALATPFTLKERKVVAKVEVIRPPRQTPFIMYGSALVSDNHFSGPGNTSLVEFVKSVTGKKDAFGFEKVTFSNNICEHRNASPKDGVTVDMMGADYLIVMGNHIDADPGVNSIRSDGVKMALLGNITSGACVGTVAPVPSTVSPASYGDHNIQI